MLALRSFLFKESDTIKKNDGIIELKCQNIIKKYVDKINLQNDVEREEYNYLGQIDFLKKYVLEVSYYENVDYKIIDKISGIEDQFGGYPYISPEDI